jgi:alpha-tubulin suppressor-like RCC1 family protein
MDAVSAIAGGAYFTLALKNDGGLWAWGNNLDGQIGDGTTTNRPSPVRIMGGVTAIAAGGWHALALKTDGTLWVWGSNSHGQLGDGRSGWGQHRTKPRYLMSGVRAIAAGASHTLALRTDGSLWACGNNEVGTLGDGTTTDRSRPVHISDGVAAIAAGAYHSLALKTDGTLWAWGSNGFGRLGDGTTIDRSRPVDVANGMVAISGGGTHTLAQKSDGSLWSWGYNFWGQLGNGTTSTRRLPARVLGFGPVLKPTAPTALTATVISSTQITLRWRDNSSTEQGFRIARKVGAAAWAPLTEVTANVIGFADTGLTPNTRYRYRVQAFNAGGTSAFATSTAVKTPR